MSENLAGIATSVALLVNPEVQADVLDAVLLRMPVWMVGTALNRQIAALQRENHNKRPGWMTTYDANDPAARVQNAVNILDTLHLHHSLMTNLHVYGLPVGGENHFDWSKGGFRLLHSEPKLCIFECHEYIFE